MRDLWVRLERAGEAWTGALAASGSALYLLANTLAGLLHLRGARLGYLGRTVLQQVYFTSVQAFGLILVVGAALGFLAALPLLSFGVTDLAVHGTVKNVVVFHQLVPFLIALIVAGRSGNAVTAELGDMQSGGTVDTLLAMGIDPHHFLVLPRMLALSLSLTLLTFWADVGSVLGAGGYNVLQGNGTLGLFIRACIEAMSPSGVLFTVLMTVTLGMTVALVHCHYGLRSQTPVEVQRNIPVAFVRSLLLIIVITVLFSLAR